MDFVSLSLIYNLILFLVTSQYCERQLENGEDKCVFISRIVGDSLVLMKVQPMRGTAKLGYQFSATTNLNRGRRVSLPLQKGLKGLNVCEIIKI